MRIETRIAVVDDDGNELEPGTQCGISLSNGGYEVGVFDRIEKGKLVFKRPFGAGAEFSHRPVSVSTIDRVSIEIVG